MGALAAKMFCDKPGCGKEIPVVTVPNVRPVLRAQDQAGTVVAMKVVTPGRHLCYDCALEILTGRGPVTAVARPARPAPKTTMLTAAGKPVDEKKATEETKTEKDNAAI